MLTVNGVGPTAINFNGTSLTQVWACNHNTGECNLVWPNLPDSFQICMKESADEIRTYSVAPYMDGCDRHCCNTDKFIIRAATDNTSGYRVDPVGTIPEVKIDVETYFPSVTCIAIYWYDYDEDTSYSGWDCYPVCMICTNVCYDTVAYTQKAELFNYPNYFPSTGRGGNLHDASNPYGITNAVYKLDEEHNYLSVCCVANCLLVDGEWVDFTYNEPFKSIKWRLKATERYTGCVYYTDWTYCNGRLYTFRRSW